MCTTPTFFGSYCFARHFFSLLGMHEVTVDLLECKTTLVATKAVMSLLPNSDNPNIKEAANKHYKRYLTTYCFQLSCVAMSENTDADDTEDADTEDADTVIGEDTTKILGRKLCRLERQLISCKRNCFLNRCQEAQCEHYILFKPTLEEFNDVITSIANLFVLENPNEFDAAADAMYTNLCLELYA